MNKLISDNRELALTTQVLLGQKVEELVLIDVRKIKTLPYDFVVIGTCQSEVQMRSVLNTARRELKGQVSPLREEYTPGVRWGVLDAGDFMVHLFEKKTREYYSLERLWADAPLIELDEQLIKPSIDSIDEALPPTKKPKAPAKTSTRRKAAKQSDDSYL